jgi:maltooligosyltrehalose synthase
MDETVFYNMGSELSAKLYNNAPVNVVLTDEKFKPLRTYVFRKSQPAEQEEKITAGNVEVYRQNGVSQDEAGKLAQFLDNLDGAGGENRKSVKIGRESDGTYRLMIVYDADYAKSVSDDEFMRMAATISDGALGGAPVLLVLTDKYYTPFKTLQYNPGTAPAELPVQ